MCAKLNFRFTEISGEIALKKLVLEKLEDQRRRETGSASKFLFYPAAKGDGNSLVLSLFYFLEILPAWNFSKIPPLFQFLMILSILTNI